MGQFGSKGGTPVVAPIKKDRDPRCGRCGHRQSKHALVNFADGQMVGGTELVCPTALFIVHEEK